MEALRGRVGRVRDYIGGPTKETLGGVLDPQLGDKVGVRGKECCSPEKIVCSNIWWRLSREHLQN